MNWLVLGMTAVSLVISSMTIETAATEKTETAADTAGSDEEKEDAASDAATSEEKTSEEDSAESASSADASESKGASGSAGASLGSSDDNGLDIATFCSFVIPKDFEMSEDRGIFVNKSYPMEASTIQFSYYDNGLEIPLTNRERLEMEQQNSELVADLSADLTRDIYEETISAAYNSEYGEDVGFKVSSFENIKVDGYPGYKIEASFGQNGHETIYQTVYLLLSRYRTFTVTFQRAEDDDCDELFRNCAATIHVH